ncbi:MAG: hydrogenase maturation nickel metallochaperone HypA [Cyclobacteriaceae bacterium]
MHEFSIVRNILAIAENEVTKAEAHKVEQIALDIGKLSGIEIDAIEFIWEAAVQESVLAQAMRIINPVPGKGFCEECNKVCAVDHLYDLCPECDGYLDIIEGKELIIRSLTLT